jgi:hypothetical protein
MTPLINLARSARQLGTALAFAAAAYSFSCPTPASAEIVYALFDQPDGGVTVGTYQGIVSVTVSGVGQSLADLYNDAFYLLPVGSTPAFSGAPYYELSFGVSALVPSAPSQAIENYIVGGVPAYSATHIYSFNLNTGSAVPTLLHFGVNDDIFSDNTGAFTIVVTQLAATIPEPSTWAMMILGFAGVGFMRYRRRKVAPIAV